MHSLLDLPCLQKCKMYEIFPVVQKQGKKISVLVGVLKENGIFA